MLAQHLFQRRGTAMLLEQITEGLISQLLQRLHTIERKFVQGVPGLRIELDAPAYGTNWTFRTRHQPAFFARFFCGGASVARLEAFAVFPLPPVSSMLRRNASMRLSTLAGRAGAFSFGAGSPACLERMSSIIAFS